ncbi:MAG: hypothetical protein PHQ60_13480 [Sideroxydans sp.]|nr:hypothetical protein [Sideroxydans sp.]
MAQLFSTPPVFCRVFHFRAFEDLKVGAAYQPVPEKWMEIRKVAKNDATGIAIRYRVKYPQEVGRGCKADKSATTTHMPVNRRSARFI